MNAQSDGMLMIRSRLCQAVTCLQANSKHMTDKAVARRMREIERIAGEYGLTPLARVARAGVYAVLGPGHRHALSCHLDRMEDASRCMPLDEDATAAILASIAVRLA